MLHCSLSCLFLILCVGYLHECKIGMFIMYMIVYIQDESVGEENRITLDDEEEEAPIVLGKSTKQPTQQVKKPTKRQKVVDAENDLLKKAIECMDRTTGKTGTSADGFEHFGRYVSTELRTELRAITTPQGQRWAKLQIQNVLYNAAQSDAVPPYSQPPMDRTPTTPSTTRRFRVIDQPVFLPEPPAFLRLRLSWSIRNQHSDIN